LTLFVDTSVWSLAFRRDMPSSSPETAALTEALLNGQVILSTGLVLQELLQGFSGPRTRDALLSRFSAIPLLSPERDDHIRAAELRNECRRSGVQVGTVDALLAQLCIHHKVTMLSADDDFRHIARHSPLDVWRSSA
jgi:predicted nucleic acid-binding protein